MAAVTQEPATDSNIFASFPLFSPVPTPSRSWSSISDTSTLLPSPVSPGVMEDSSGTHSPATAPQNKYIGSSKYPYMATAPVARTSFDAGPANGHLPGYFWAGSSHQEFPAPPVHVLPHPSQALGLDINNHNHHQHHHHHHLPTAFDNSFPAFGYSAPPPPIPTNSFANGSFPSAVDPGSFMASTRDTPDEGPDAAGSPEYPASPLQALPDDPDSPLLPLDNGIKGRLRRQSEPDYLGKHSPANRVAAHRRKSTWSEGLNEGPNVSREQKERELMELERLSSAGPAARRDKRRLQNRLAQRSFRARAKISDKEAANHLAELERIARETQEKLEQTEEALRASQSENAMLRARLDQRQ